MQTRSRGRPKGPEKVVFKRRVDPSLVEKIDECIRKAALKRCGLPEDTPWPEPVQEAVPCDSRPPSLIKSMESLLEDNLGLKSQIKALLEDVDRLTKEVALYEVKRENWMRATESQRLNGVWKEVDRWKGRARELEEKLNS
jgi:hypothetical protein